MKTITCIEYEKIENDPAVISEKHFRELHTYALTNRGQKVLTAGIDFIKPKNYVGVIQTRSGCILEILPKIFRKNNNQEGDEYRRSMARKTLGLMLRTVTKLPDYKKIDFSHLHPSKMPIYEVFITMFLDEVDKIIKKGMKSDYCVCEENANYLRGKLVAGEHIKRNIVHRERFFVAYDRYICDIPKNRIIKTALHHCNKLTGSMVNKRKITELLFVFDEVQVTEDPDLEYSRIKEDRTSDYYARALTWAMLFLKDKSVTTYTGNTIAFALLFPMEKVFESFVFHCIKKHSGLSDVRQQSSRHYLAREEGESSDIPIFQLKPDITAKGNGTLYIMDTKWKILDSSKRERNYDISQGDMYQMLSYAKVYQNCNSEKVENGRDRIQLYLIYPMNEYFRERIVLRYNDVDGVEMNVVPFEIEGSSDNFKYYNGRFDLRY